MADPKAPDPLEYIELECAHCATDQQVDLDDLREALSAHGLHIVSEADRKVIEAWRELDRDDLRILQSTWTGAVSVCATNEIQRRDSELEARKTRAK